MPAAERTPLACHEVPLGTRMIMRPAVNAKEANSALQVYLQLGPTTPRLRSLQLLCEQVSLQHLDTANVASHGQSPAPCQQCGAKGCVALQIVKESLWHKLRTEQQLGYAVGSSPTDTAQVLGFLVSISSEQHPEKVELAISQFLDNALEDIKALSADAFADHVESVSIALREAPNNVNEQADYHWRCLCDNHYNFYKRYQVGTAIESPLQRCSKSTHTTRSLVYAYAGR